MTYQIKHAKKNGFGGTFSKLLAVFIFAAIGLALLSFGPVNTAVSGVFSPFFKAGNYFYDSLGALPKFFSSKTALVRENEDLIKETERNRANSLDYLALKSENERLREALQLRPEGNYVTAAVLAKPPQTIQGVIILDRGTMDGISVGDEVFISEKVIIGKISEVTSNRSVLTLNSFGGVVSYGLVDRTGEPLEMKGTGSGSLEARVPIDFDIAEGDVVVKNDSATSLIAVVGEVEKDSHSGVQDIFLSMPIDVSKISLVFVRSMAEE